MLRSDTLIHCIVINTSAWANTPQPGLTLLSHHIITVSFLGVRSLTISSLGSLDINNPVLLTVISMRCIRSVELNHVLVTSCRLKSHFPISSTHPVPNNSHSDLCFYNFDLFWRFHIYVGLYRICLSLSAYITKHNTTMVHSCCCKWPHFLPFCAWIIFCCVYIFTCSIYVSIYRSSIYLCFYFICIYHLCICVPMYVLTNIYLLISITYLSMHL